MSEEPPQIPPAEELSEDNTTSLQYAGEDEVVSPEGAADPQARNEGHSVKTSEDTRIQDPEEAHVKALAGNEERSNAAGHRGAAEMVGGNSPAAERVSEIAVNAAIEADSTATKLEEEVGKQYEEQKSTSQELSATTQETQTISGSGENTASIELVPNEELSHEDQARILEHMASLLRKHSISPAYREAHLSMGGDISTAEGLVTLGLKAHRQAQGFDELKYKDPVQALAKLEEAKSFVQVLADIESGVASNDDYQKTE
ncbi:hypothetical protein H0X09_01630 [Candidatus Saccharibacteria bacterium]|nr:hypothetical protein [Candidatus Saccharibacteria bacterium]